MKYAFGFVLSCVFRFFLGLSFEPLSSLTLFCLVLFGLSCSLSPTSIAKRVLVSASCPDTPTYVCSCRATVSGATRPVRVMLQYLRVGSCPLIVDYGPSPGVGFVRSPITMLDAVNPVRLHSSDMNG